MIRQLAVAASIQGAGSLGFFSGFHRIANPSGIFSAAFSSLQNSASRFFAGVGG